MNTQPDSLERLRKFVCGDMSVPDFEEMLYHEPEIETLLSAERAPQYCHSGTTVYHYLIALDYNDPGDVLNAQGALIEVLSRHGVAVKPSSVPLDEYNLLLLAQPSWLDADSRYLAELLAKAPQGLGEKRKEWLQKKILEVFRFVRQPPEWLQSPSWPIGKSGPLVFLGQFDLDGYFHDTATVYVFHDPATGVCETLIQVA